MNDKKDSFVFYRSFLEALEELDAEDFKAAVIALAEYGMDKKEPDCKGVVKAIFTLAKPILDTNYQKWEKSKTGGRPKQNQEETINKPSINQEQTISKPSDNQEQTKSKPYVDVDVDVNVDVEEKKKRTRTKPKPDKLVFGEYKHVRLTIEQYDKLAADYGEQMRDDAVRRLDEYIQEKPKYKSEDHNLAIRRWVIKAVEEDRGNPKVKKTAFHNMDMKHNYDYAAMEQQLLQGG